MEEELTEKEEYEMLEDDVRGIVVRASSGLLPLAIN